jgi:hypothetical protein
MTPQQRQLWFTVLSIILVAFGVVYTIFGLGILPVDRDVLLQWESALYGAIMIGWGLTLLLIGRVVLRRDDRELTKQLLIGLGAWLFVEAVFSALYGVWFNVGVDVGVFVLFSVPLIAGIRSAR